MSKHCIESVCGGRVQVAEELQRMTTQLITVISDGFGSRQPQLPQPQSAQDRRQQQQQHQQQQQQSAKARAVVQRQLLMLEEMLDEVLSIDCAVNRLYC
jgi:hypothetical protein